VSRLALQLDNGPVFLIQLKNLMEYLAYEIPQPRILGGPKWLDSERFDIEAKMESAGAERLKVLSHDQRKSGDAGHVSTTPSRPVQTGRSLGDARTSGLRSGHRKERTHSS
jgi:hypothetical protein